MERCPNCRARLDGTQTCRRCGMDLAALMEVDEAAEHLMQLGASHLAAGNAAAARAALTRSLALRREPLVQTLLGFARTLAGEGPEIA